jgi:hypothetical protein
MRRRRTAGGSGNGGIARRRTWSGSAEIQASAASREANDPPGVVPAPGALVRNTIHVVSSLMAA